MIRIAPQVFWDPMAFAMIGGILAVTCLTLFFLPALYVSWFRINASARETPLPGHQVPLAQPGHS